MNRFIILFLLISISGCHAENIDEIDVRVLELDPQNVQQLKFSDIVSEFKFVKLNTPENIYFGNADKIIVSDNRIYVLDIFTGEKLLVFDIHGEFIFEISTHGRGPGELLQPADFIVDTEGEKIVILDQGNIKLSFYNIADGSFIEDKTLNFWTYYFHKNGEGYVFFNNNLQNAQNNHNVLFTDNSLTIINREQPIPGHQRNFHYALPRKFTSYKDRVYLTIPFNNTIYTVSDNQAVPYLVLDFGDLNIPGTFFETFTDNRERIQEVKNYGFNVTNYFESDEFVFFNYRYMNNTNYYFQSKKTGVELHTNNQNLSFDVGFGPMMLWPMEVSENYLVWQQEPFKLKSYVDNVKNSLSDAKWKDFEQTNRDLIEFSNSIDPNDNAYLILTKLDF
ncbi:MAG: 6-bladed beta-propeller [Balneolaceae bacterium]